MPSVSFDDRYSRQVLFGPIGAEGQARLTRARVTIVGCGALGTHSASWLVRAGIGFLRIVDRDFVEPGNLQRQILYDEEDARRRLPKAAAAAERLRRINAAVMVEAAVDDLTTGNAARLLGDADLILDGADNFETRLLINDVAVRDGRPWIYAACVGSYGMTMTIRPGATPCFRCLVPRLPAPGSTPTCDTAGVLAAAAAAVAALQTTEAIKILTGNEDVLAPGLAAIDVWTGTHHRLDIPRDPECPACARRTFEYLEARGTGQAVTLCGRNAVQVSPPDAARVDLAALAQRLAPLGPVERNAYLVRFSTGGLEMTIFGDGRAIIGGTADPAAARAAYAKFVGA